MKKIEGRGDKKGEEKKGNSHTCSPYLKLKIQLNLEKWKEIKRTSNKKRVLLVVGDERTTEPYLVIESEPIPPRRSTTNKKAQNTTFLALFCVFSLVLKRTHVVVCFYFVYLLFFSVACVIDNLAN